MALRNLEQERAKYSLEEVAKAATEMGDNAKYYKSYVKKMPSLILGSGLIAAMAFCKKQKMEGKSKAYHLIYNSLFNWLKKHEACPIESNGDFLKLLCSKKSHDVRLYTFESIALLGWMKRMAEAEIEGESND